MKKIKTYKCDYEMRKEAARTEAIMWQCCDCIEDQYLFMDQHGFDDATAYFRKLGKRYGLIREFTENGIL